VTDGADPAAAALELVAAIAAASALELFALFLCHGSRSTWN
jgi:hypothetical protein